MPLAAVAGVVRSAVLLAVCNGHGGGGRRFYLPFATNAGTVGAAVLLGVCGGCGWRDIRRFYLPEQLREGGFGGCMPIESQIFRHFDGLCLSGLSIPAAVSGRTFRRGAPARCAS